MTRKGSEPGSADLSGFAPVERIRAAALALLREGGVSALTTRAVCERAGVTAPTLYHHYGDKDGLLRAVSASEMQSFFTRKQRMKTSADSRRDVMRGWDDWIEFAIEQPDLVRAMRASGASAVPMRQAAEAIVQSRLLRLAQSVQLTVDIPTGARLLVAAADAVVQLLLDGTSPADTRRLSALLRDAVLGSIAPRNG
jgi:AcrR family transcriptional regulator